MATSNRFSQLTAILGSGTNTDGGFGRAAKNVGCPIDGLVSKGIRPIVVLENINRATSLFIFLQAEQGNLKPGTGEEAIKTFNYFSNGVYEVPSDLSIFNPDFSDREDGGRSIAVGDKTAHIFFILGDDPNSLQRDCLVKKVAETIFDMKQKDSRLLVSGPDENGLPGIGQAVENLFTLAFSVV